ncbi:MAG: dihydropteroate synthase [Candidatus Saccharicenans sp.]|nr:MAG: dihydropteroate synthase [Candidatus Aminicenantes bacterium]HEK85738.1 dihydropteroate synthase [Candidatus Aminicenantes bacterium]
MIGGKTQIKQKWFEVPTYQLDIRGQKLTIGPRPWIMGVVNVTPDSFSDGGKFYNVDKAVERALELVGQGARIIDIGGESTRPGAREVPAEEELQRVIPVIKRLRPKTSALISADTRKSLVAQAALEEGADIINDISAFSHDPKMAQVVAAFQVPVIIMHMLGTPETMQLNPQYRNLLFDLKYFFLDRIRQAREAGIPEDRIILDPGIGFGKTLEHNLTIINHLDYFLDLNKPILVGPSRKSFIGGILGVPADQRLEGTISAVLISLIRGASLIRVHDVLEIKRALQTAESIVNEIRMAD